MSRRYYEPTIYRDRQCLYCGCYFTARGLHGHIRFRHQARDKVGLARRKSRLFDRAMSLGRKGITVPGYIVSQLGTYSDATQDDLDAIEALLDQWDR